LQVDVLERDTLEVLSMVRSMKNDFALINRIPGAVLRLIPTYLECQDTETGKDLIMLTHVCRGWRELFTSHPSLWTRLDFTNVDKTRAYIERSRSLPLDVVVCKSEYNDNYCLEDALLLAVPHIKRFKSLTISGTSDPLQHLTKHLTLPAPFLRELTIDLYCDSTPVLNSALFNGVLLSLRTLTLGGVVTHLPWKNLWSLTTFKLGCTSENRVTVIQLLNFFESAPRLRDITLHHAIPTSSNAPSSRVVPLPHLENLTIFANSAHSILLNHLSIPAGASLVLRFGFRGDKSPLPDYLPKSIKNLPNLFRITAVNLCLERTEKFVHLIGPSGGLYIFGYPVEMTPSLDLDRRILHSLNYFSLHMTRSLAITEYEPSTLTEINKSPPYHILLHMSDLHTLTLTRCNNLPFILALNPDYNPSKLVPCPNLEELVLYVETRNEFNIPELMNMAKERASKGAKLRSVTIVGLGELVPGKEVFKLRKHVAHVEYRFEENPPKWDSTPGCKSD